MKCILVSPGGFWSGKTAYIGRIRGDDYYATKNVVSAYDFGHWVATQIILLRNTLNSGKTQIVWGYDGMKFQIFNKSGICTRRNWEIQFKE